MFFVRHCHDRLGQAFHDLPLGTAEDAPDNLDLNQWQGSPLALETFPRGGAVSVCGMHSISAMPDGFAMSVTSLRPRGSLPRASDKNGPFGPAQRAA